MKQHNIRYQSTDEIIEIINEYHQNRRSLARRKAEEKDEMRSFGVTCLSIESTLPRGNAITRSVENEAIRLATRSVYWDSLAQDIDFINRRIDRITDAHHRIILEHRLNGLSITEISRRCEKGRPTVYKIIKEIAERMRVA